MRTVTISVSSLDEVKQRLRMAFDGKRQKPRISFASEELLLKLLTQKRFQVLKVMAGAGPIGLREIARQVGRDVKGVHTDLQALLKARVIEQHSDAKYEFPYDAIHVDFTVSKAA